MLQGAGAFQILGEGSDGGEGVRTAGRHQRLSGPARPLSGCVNDVERMRTLLTTRIEDEGKLQLVALTDAEATREAVIGAFRSHLGQAESDDVALFYYSGHGSQEHAAELWHQEPDRSTRPAATTAAWMDTGTSPTRSLSRLIAEVAEAAAHRGDPRLLPLGVGTRAADDDAVRASPTRGCARSTRSSSRPPRPRRAPPPVQRPCCRRLGGPAGRQARPAGGLSRRAGGQGAVPGAASAEACSPIS